MIKLILIFIGLQILLLIPSYCLHKKYLKRKYGIKNLKIYSFLATILLGSRATNLLNRIQKRIQF